MSFKIYLVYLTNHYIYRPLDKQTLCDKFLGRSEVLRNRAWDNRQPIKNFQLCLNSIKI